MCGIAGFISKNRKFDKKKYVKNIIRDINHRGPDENGVFQENDICLLNTRLSIIDVSHGHQPFISDDESVIVVQNGEIYNFIEIKEELQSNGVTFKTNSDTEVILQAYIAYGTECFTKFNGMFAIAIHDKNKNKIILGRDRLGVKPLYIYRKNDDIHFSSEIKSFLNYDLFDNSIDKQSIHNYFKFNYIPLPNTIYKYVSHIKPAHFYEIDVESFTVKSTEYWSMKNEKEINIDEDELIERIDEILTDAIKIRLRSDVGIGAFLSGGLDSSLVVAMAKEKFGVNLENYTIGFNEKEYDESIYAKQVSDLFNLKNNVHILDSDIVDLWKKTTWHNDQPHGDVSFIPTFILSEFAAEDYKLVFTGDGGDEAFAGYTKYFSLFENDMEEYFNSISLIKDDTLFNDLYLNDFRKNIDYHKPHKIFFDTINEINKKDDINKILYFDTKQLLPGNNLVKPDKMAMAHSLETRSPLLDYRLFALMQSVSGKFKLTNNESKYILKKLALKYLPYDIVYREKQMFTVPIGEWFKTKLKDYIIEIIDSESLKSRGIFNTVFLNKMLHEHINGIKDYTRELRAIVNLELWFREFYDKGDNK